MKITFETGGGFALLPAPGQPVIIDTAQVDPQVADQLETLVRESRFFELPALIDTTQEGAADYFTYTVTVQDGPLINTVQLTEPIADAVLERLVSGLQRLARPSTPGRLGDGHSASGP
jgi:hypothetical protein